MTNDCFLQVHSVEEVPLAYLPECLTRVQVRVVGSLKGFLEAAALPAQATETARSSLADSTRCPILCRRFSVSHCVTV